MQEPLSNSEKTHYTNLWCRDQGIKSRDLEEHPQIDDCIILMNIRNEFWTFMDAKERGVWSAYWDWTYHKKFPLKQKHLDKLEKLSNSAIFRQHIQAKRVETIKAMRSRLTAKAQSKTVSS